MQPSQFKNLNRFKVEDQFAFHNDLFLFSEDGSFYSTISSQSVFDKHKFGLIKIILRRLQRKMNSKSYYFFLVWNILFSVFFPTWNLTFRLQNLSKCKNQWNLPDKTISPWENCHKSFSFGNFHSVLAI